MKKANLFCILLLCDLLCILVPQPFASDTSIRVYPLPNNGSLLLQVPTAWRDQVRQPPDKLPPTIKFSQQTSDSFVVLFTPLWAANKNIILPDGPKLRQMVQQSAENAKSQTIEKTLNLIEMKGTSGIGFYFTATDKAPKPGEYKFLAQGLIRVGDLMVSFTILTNDGQKEFVSKALTMLRTAKHNKQT